MYYQHQFSICILKIVVSVSITEYYYLFGYQRTIRQMLTSL